jgi:hypothetical protein
MRTPEPAGRQQPAYGIEKSPTARQAPVAQAGTITAKKKAGRSQYNQYLAGAGSGTNGTAGVYSVTARTHGGVMAMNRQETGSANA